MSIATLNPAQSPSSGPPRRPVPRSAILATAAYLPPGVLTNADLEAMVDTSDRWIMERTGIRNRHLAGSGETAANMAAAAARGVLERLPDAAVDCLMVATCSPDTLLPSTACLVQRELGLAVMPALDINAACSGFVYGLTLADSLVRSGTASCVLVVATEAMSHLVDYGDRSTCVLFGDGAGAVLVGPAEGDRGIRAVRWAADGGEADLIYFGPRQDDDTAPDRLRMAGRGTFRLAVERLCEVTRELCGDAGWSVEDVDHFIPHQANLRIIEAAAKRLGVPASKVITNVEAVGNTSAASIPLALDEATRSGRIRPGDRVVVVAFGAGATWGGAAFVAVE